MLSLIAILVTIALLDSTSMIPIALVPLIAIMAGSRPIIGSLSFIAGIFFVYFISGLALLIAFDLVLDVISPTLLRIWKQPYTAELILQLIIGFVLLFAAWKQYQKDENKIPDSPTEELMSPVRAFILGASLTIIGMPGAIPYFGAIEQILRADPGAVGSFIALVTYNIAFVTPFIGCLLVRLLAQKQSDAIFNTISGFTQRWGSALVIIAMVLLGITLAADAIGWFMGMPLLPVD